MNIPKTKILLLFLALSGILFSCTQDPGQYYTITGFTQGTSYRITYQHPTQSELKAEVDSLLRLFDLSLSSYDTASIISRINRNEAGVETDSLFRTVFRESKQINMETAGAFDISLAPVINAWGFGPGSKMDVDSATIDSLLQFVGMDKAWLEGTELIKSDPRLQLNVNAIAQGFSVDYLCAYFESIGCKNYMVEVGGEIRTKGINPKGVFWRIGIDRPMYGSMIPGSQMQAVINMQNRSLATSGNYRKFYEKDGKRITHSIDPLTGFPKESSLLSVTILTDNCMAADAYATSCMVMGYEKAKEFVSDRDEIDAYFIIGNDSGEYDVWYSKRLEKYIEKP